MSWRKAGRCQSGECFEVDDCDCADPVRRIRDSKVPAVVLEMPREEFAEFVEAIKAGDFDYTLAE
jgi:hypothetical protein